MDLDTITMDPDVARKKVTEYRNAAKESHSKEDAAIARGYLHAAEGRPLIRLTEAIRAGGRDENGRPNLAVAKADEKWCYLISDRPDTETRYRMVGAPDRRTASSRFWNDGKTVQTFRFPTVDGAKIDNAWAGMRSQVPIVPPGLRPTKGGLHLYHVLWEVEEWAPEPRPPSDPALIRQIAGDLWAVFGTWDLTDLERAVLGGRT
jgi:hypothetical protein